MEMKVDGVLVSFEKCHCGVTPTEVDARETLKDKGQLCGYCKEPIKVTHLQMMEHRPGPKGNAWSCGWSGDPCIEMGSYSQLGDYRKVVHPGCWEKIFGEKLPADVRR